MDDRNACLNMIRNTLSSSICRNLLANEKAASKAGTTSSILGKCQQAEERRPYAILYCRVTYSRDYYTAWIAEFYIDMQK